MTVLAFETSCDETAIAIVRDGKEIVSSELASQIPMHIRFGGVVPEVSSRAHLEALPHVLTQALDNSGLSWQEIDRIAATAGPGLQGALLVGFQAAQSLAWAKGKPFFPTNHLAGHLYANWLTSDHAELAFPLLGLVISGGHTLLVEMKGHHEFHLLGQTLDDAAGEAFDKVARLMDLPYPGGPEISKLAATGNRARYELPRALTKASAPREHRLDFSFSGLKTAVRRLTEEISPQDYPDLAASFEEAVVDVVAIKVETALSEGSYHGILTGGGVMANSRLRERLEQLASRNEVPLFVPPISLCTDNAAVIAAAANFASHPAPARVDPNLPLVDARGTAA